MNVCGVNINQAYRNLQPLVQQLLDLHCTRDEIISDLYTTVLICKKDFKPSAKTNFYKYLYTAFKNNLNRKIYAIKMRFGSECPLHESMPAKEKSPAEEALLEIPEIEPFLYGEIDSSELAEICTSADIKYSDVINRLDNYLPQ
ncbi:MAG TPA: hypothetical protein V6C58_08840 [Allocoleopsis sp.]|jgi:hypothetical protein